MKQQNPKRAVIQLLVRNHPGVMSHVCGLFARRNFNLEGIASLPVGDGSRSRIWLSIHDDSRIDQTVKQLQKLQDVLDVQLHTAEHEVFSKLEDFFRDHPEARPPEPAAKNGAKN